jgi:tRNA modification GTPase
LGADAKQADEAVLLVRATEPVPWLELHCHGGPEVVRFIQDQFGGLGIPTVPWTAFEAGWTPAWNIAAAEVLAHAPTVRTAAIALDQWHGAFQNRWGAAKAAVEAGDIPAAQQIVKRLAELAPVGRRLTRPWRVVIAGAANVGKSSLINALAGFTRAVVTPEPGATRDVVTTTIALDGWPVEVSDTAGLRVTSDPLEQEGLRRARAALKGADLRVWVLDGAAAPVWPDAGAIDEGVWLFAINKMDLPAAWDWSAQPTALRLSARTGTGVPELAQAIVQQLVPRPPAPGEAVPYTDEMCAAVEQFAMIIVNC